MAPAKVCPFSAAIVGTGTDGHLSTLMCESAACLLTGEGEKPEEHRIVELWVTLWITSDEEEKALDLLEKKNGSLLAVS